MGKGISEVDPVLDALGGRSKYQFMQFFLVMLSAISTSFQLLNIVFVGRGIPHTCTEPENISAIFQLLNDERFHINTSTVEFQKCSIKVASNVSGTVEAKHLGCVYGQTFAERKDLSVMSDMDVICEKASLKGLGQTLLILGQGIGASFFPIFSDRYGRRPVHLLSHFLVLCLGVSVAFSPTYLVFLVLRVFLGACQQGIVMTQTTFYVEVFPARYRRISGLLASLLWSCFTMLIALVGFLTRDLSWRKSQLIYCIGGLYVFIQFFVVDESLRWLMANGKHKQIMKILKKAARINGKNSDEVINVYMGLKEKYEGQSDLTDSLMGSKMSVEEEHKLSLQEKHKGKVTFLDLMKNKRLALNVVILWFIWLTDSMTFFGLFMTAHSLAGSRFVNFFLFALLESPSAFVFYFMIDRYGRRRTSMTLHCVAGCGLILATVLRHVGGGSHWFEVSVTAFSCVGVFGISGAWGASFFFTPEMFPTNLRNFGLGTSSSFSRIGGMLAPFASLLAEYVPWAPGAIFGGCCLLVTILVNLLPETMGRELPQTLYDLEQWYKETPADVNETKETKTKENKLLSDAA